VLWEQPLRLGEALLPEFPIETLAGWQRQFAEALSIATQTPIDLAAMLILATTSLAIAKKAVVLVKPGYAEPLNLFLVVCQPPGARKSAVYRLVLQVVKDYEREKAIAAGPAIASALSLTAITEKQLQAKQNEAAKNTGEKEVELKQQAETLAQQLLELKIPSHPLLITTDATPEHLVTLMARNFGRIAVMSPEGGPFGMMAGRYQRQSSRQSPNIDVYLKSHAGDDIRVDRAGRPPDDVRNPSLVIGLTVQPDVIQSLASDASFRGRGLLGRILYSMPESKIGHRMIDPPPVSPALTAEYESHVRSLLEIPFNTDGPGGQVEKQIQLSPAASQILRTFDAWVEPQLASAGPLAHMADWGGKLVGAVVRIAGLLHVADLAGNTSPWGTSIAAQTMERAVEIGRYLIPHARAAFFEMGGDHELDDARYLLAWVLRHGQESFTRRECFEGTRGKFKKVDKLEPVLRLLERYNYIRTRTEERRLGAGRPPSPRFDVNPSLWTAADVSPDMSSPGNQEPELGAAEELQLPPLEEESGPEAFADQAEPVQDFPADGSQDDDADMEEGLIS
jgi:replicative DNA helicase